MAAKMNLADLYLLGDTAIPDDLSGADAPGRSKASSEKWMQPWFDLTKDHVVKLMRDLDLDEVMELTHTCTESTGVRCGKCWQCRERAWAFGRAAITDTGGM
jgi:7-cyano-7-deazaguanine synthase in queuosine biosynthesis